MHPYRFAAAAFSAGIDTTTFDGTKVQVYSAEKTLADCCKFRNEVGQSVVLETLQLYRTRKRFDPAALLKYASICRVDSFGRATLIDIFHFCN
ncbi:MAG TPA: hypothetical protein VIC26_07530 [Marinagarivorans sp.]